MAPAPHAQFRLHQELGALPRIEEYAGVLPQIQGYLGFLPFIEESLRALPRIERDLAELINCLPRGSRDIEIGDEDVKQACVFLCRAVRQDDLRLVDRHVWVKHFKRIGLPSCIKIAQLPGDVSSVTDQIQQMFEAENILDAPSRAAIGVIVVASRSAAQALGAERGRRK
jgi:hypothetical protein